MRLIGVILIFILLPLVSASQIQFLGTFQQDNCVELKQTCANCTFVNITSVISPLSNQLLGEVAMQQTGTEYNVTFCDTSTLGRYIVSGKGDPDGTLTIFSYDFKITTTGIEPTIAQGIIYLFIGVLGIFLFSLSLYGSIKIPWKHPRNDRGLIVGLNDLKYVKLLLWFVTYLMLIFVTFAFRHVSFIADWDVAGNFLHITNIFLLAFLLPIFVIVFTTGIISYLDAKKIDNLLSRGLKVK